MTATILSVDSGRPSRATDALRRGACPSLSAPMQTGDGLLVRFRPFADGLPPASFAEIARLAALHGNGLIEVTMRGSLQIRGLSAESVSRLASAFIEAGIRWQNGIAVEVPPLAGGDPSEIADPRPIATAIRKIAADRNPPLALAPKLAIVVDGGGRLHLGESVADLRLDAIGMRGSALWRLAIGGDRQSARPVAEFLPEAVPQAVMAVLEKLASAGTGTRGRDLEIGGLISEARGQCDPEAEFANEPHPGFVGAHTIGGAPILGIGLRYGQVQSPTLSNLMKVLAEIGASEVLPSPGRALLIRGLERSTVPIAQAAARSAGFSVDGHEPGNFIAVCAGSLGCASGHFDTRAVADALVEKTPALFDGSISVHVSGCTKGCARPAPAALALSGTAAGIGLVLHGKAGDRPVARTSSQKISEALATIEALLERQRSQGISARGALDKIGEAVLAAAFQQGRQ
ncbi:precorrin-3B synthase [Sinorhizobium sp. BG8]|uniref:precorrin-3B synthase n=1 Tax=Sinorhizobium sp. BG8 TaxID=2613773 RepID=UPI00193EAF61|nr:precorrin-3B synthase [Sinorhizobium sp. BG8]QRM53567.1 precorrin-3B synthase [Sinorhizobium sp. BG8]